MKKTIIIEESRINKLINSIFESVFYPRAEQVIEVENFLNHNFKPRETPTINQETGYSDLEKNFVMFKNGVDLQTMTPKELLRMLDDKFHHRIKDDDDRKRFLKQVINDWYMGKIKNGILSVNHV